MTTQKTGNNNWDKPVFPSENLAGELDNLISQIDNSVQTGRVGAFVIDNGGQNYVYTEDGIIYEGTGDAEAIQSGIDYLANNFGGSISIPSGVFEIDSTITVKDNIELIQGRSAYLKNTQSDGFSPTFLFQNGTKIPSLKLDANGGSGVAIGEPYTSADIEAGVINVYNAGKSYNSTTNTGQFAVKVQGYNTSINHIHTFGGNQGIALNGASDIYIHSGIAINASTGFLINACEHVFISDIDIDSCTYKGITMNASNDVNISATIWNNANAYSNASLSSGLSVGKYATCKNVNAKTSHIGHGGTGIDLYSVENSNLEFNISNTDLNTSTATINVGVETRSGTSDTTSIKGVINSVGTSLVRGGGSIQIDGVTEHTGNATFSGTGSQTEFTTTHDLDYKPNDPAEYVVTGSPVSVDAQSSGYLSACPLDSGSGSVDSIKFIFNNAPPSGTDNVEMTWKMELV